MRTCVGCRRRAPASELVRLTAVDGELVLGPGRGGRGAWLCADDPARCLDAAGEGGLKRALRQPLMSHSITAIRQALQ